mgnify:CR=1 FL=1
MTAPTPDPFTELTRRLSVAGVYENPEGVQLAIERARARWIDRLADRVWAEAYPEDGIVLDVKWGDPEKVTKQAVRDAFRDAVAKFPPQPGKSSYADGCVCVGCGDVHKLAPPPEAPRATEPEPVGDGYIYVVLELGNGAELPAYRSPNGVWWWETLPDDDWGKMTHGEWDDLLSHFDEVPLRVILLATRPAPDVSE